MWERWEIHQHSFNCYLIFAIIRYLLFWTIFSRYNVIVSCESELSGATRSCSSTSSSRSTSRRLSSWTQTRSWGPTSLSSGRLSSWTQTRSWRLTSPNSGRLYYFYQDSIQIGWATIYHSLADNCNNINKLKTSTLISKARNSTALHLDIKYLLLVLLKDDPTLLSVQNILIAMLIAYTYNNLLLRDLDLEGAPYGYTPFCDSNKDMEGFRFWKQVLITNHLQVLLLFVSWFFFVKLNFNY